MNIIGSSSRFGSYIACDRQPILASGAASDRYVPRSALSPSKRSSLHVSVQRNDFRSGARPRVHHSRPLVSRLHAPPIRSATTSAPELPPESHLSRPDATHLILSGHSRSIGSVSWNPDGTRLASCSDDHTVKVWDLSAPRELCLTHTLQGHTHTVYAGAWSPDGTRFASASADCTIRLWDPVLGTCLNILHGHKGPVLALSWHPKGTRIATSSDDTTVRVWGATSGKCLHRLDDHTSSVFAVSWSPDGTRLASGSDDDTIRIWDPNAGRCVHTLQGHSGDVDTVSWSPNGARLASSSDDHTVKVWDPVSGTCLQTLSGHTKHVEAVAWSPEGAHLATGSSDATVRVWSLESGLCWKTLCSHTTSVAAVAWSPTNDLLASGSDDGTVRVLDPLVGLCLCTLEGHSSAIVAVSWSPDGSQLATGAADGTIRVWPALEWSSTKPSTLATLNKIVMMLEWTSEEVASLREQQAEECAPASYVHEYDMTDVKEESNHLFSIQLELYQIKELLNEMIAQQQIEVSIQNEPRMARLEANSITSQARMDELQEGLAHFRTELDRIATTVAILSGTTISHVFPDAQPEA